MATILRSNHPHRRPLAIADLEDLPSDGRRYEIMGGQLFATPAPTVLHQWIAAQLVAAFNRFFEEQQLGIAIPAPVDVLLGENDVVQPDVIVVTRENRGVLEGKRIAGAPDLLVEVTSPSTAGVDFVRKAALYAREGVREYWIADVEAREILVQRLENGRYVMLSQSDGAIRSSLFPDFVLDAARSLEFPAWMVQEDTSIDDC